MSFLSKLFGKHKSGSDLSEFNRYEIDFCCPNSGPWKSLHCIYRLRPVDRYESEIWIAVPRTDEIWNFMTFHHNNHFAFDFPFDVSQFHEESMDYSPVKKRIKLYVFNSLR